MIKFFSNRNMNDTAIPKKTAPPPAELLSVVEISTSILP